MDGGKNLVIAWPRFIRQLGEQATFSRQHELAIDQHIELPTLAFFEVNGSLQRLFYQGSGTRRLGR